MPQDADQELDSLDREMTSLEDEFNSTLKDLRNKQASALTRLHGAIDGVKRAAAAERNRS